MKLRIYQAEFENIDHTKVSDLINFNKNFQLINSSLHRTTIGIDQYRKIKIGVDIKIVNSKNIIILKCYVHLAKIIMITLFIIVSPTIITLIETQNTYSVLIYFLLALLLIIIQIIIVKSKLKKIVNSVFKCLINEKA
ncbi:MAG: hypothetical protein N4A74_10115 [Carboxylicivirga sp.]|jgi:hypothetical protein|nr:hypothetical protein [Carboxylicivirga sp.]